MERCGNRFNRSRRKRQGRGREGRAAGRLREGVHQLRTGSVGQWEGGGGPSPAGRQPDRQAARRAAWPLGVLSGPNGPCGALAGHGHPSRPRCFETSRRLDPPLYSPSKPHAGRLRLPCTCQRERLPGREFSSSLLLFGARARASRAARRQLDRVPAFPSALGAALPLGPFQLTAPVYCLEERLSLIRCAVRVHCTTSGGTLRCLRARSRDLV